ICTNREGIQEIITCYNDFSAFSGVKLNIPKTEIMKLGINHDVKEKFTITKNKEKKGDDSLPSLDLLSDN
ncbi:MAG: hypothetical protein ACOVJ8_07020, partial [Sediminibacterium sp.]